MTNEQLKRAIESITGGKVSVYIRMDTQNWYDGQANSGEHVVYSWSEHYSRSDARNALLTSLLNKVNS